MSDRRPEHAVRAYVSSLQRCASCVTEAVFIRKASAPSQHRAIGFPGDTARLRGVRSLDLFVLVEYSVEEDVNASARWTVRSAGYRYEFLHAAGPMLLAYHCDPAGVRPITFSHLHFGGSVRSVDLSKSHLPTGLVTLQDVLRFAIADLGVEPLRNN